MNKKLIMALAFGSLLFATSCKDKDNGPAPSTELSAVTAESIYFIEEVDNKSTYDVTKPTRKAGDETIFGGRVRIKWDIPVDVDYHHINIRYNVNGKAYLHQASAYANEAIIGDLLAKYGDITFSVTPCSKTGVEGKAVSVVAKASPVEKQNRIIKVAFPLSENDIWTDNQEKSEGPMKNLLDDDDASFFHMAWKGATSFPHWMVFKLPNPRKSFKFFYKDRNDRANGIIKRMEIYASNKFDYFKFDEPFTYEVGTKTKAKGNFNKDSFNPVTDPKVQGVKVKLLDRDLGKGNGAQYISEQFVLDKPAQYVIVKVLEGASSDWIALGAWKFFDEKTAVFDPENGVDETQE